MTLPALYDPRRRGQSDHAQDDALPTDRERRIPSCWKPGDGQTALGARAAKQRPDLVFAGLRAPRHGRPAADQEPPRSSRALDVPVLVITGMVSQLEELRGQGDRLRRASFQADQPDIDVVATHLISGSQEIGRTVLGVDDEALGRARRDAGFTVETAPSGFEALIVARASPPDAILSDILMPGMDGFALCNAVPGTRVFLASPRSYCSHRPTLKRPTSVSRARWARTRWWSERRTCATRWCLSGHSHAAQPQAMAAPDELETLHRERVQIQLERQIQRLDALTRQGAIQSAALSVVRGLGRRACRTDEVPRGTSWLLPGRRGYLHRLSLPRGTGPGVASAGRCTPPAARDTPPASDVRRSCEACSTPAPPPPTCPGPRDKRLGHASWSRGSRKRSRWPSALVVGEERVGVLVLAADCAGPVGAGVGGLCGALVLPIRPDDRGRPVAVAWRGVRAALPTA